MIYTAIDNFYVSEEQLEDTPSRRDGISKEIENQLRIYGCEVIQEGGILLKLPQAVMATAQVLLQRFYVKESMLQFNIKRVAWACCWLATKLEETPRRIRDVLSVFYRVDRRREGKSLQCLDIYGQEYAALMKELVSVERHLLRTFGFVLHVDHPHKFVLNYLNILKAGTELKQEAWNLANDSLRTTLSVRFRGETVACGIIFLASRRLQEPLPEEPAWWELFKVEKQDMYAVARQVHALFSMPKVQYISVYRASKQLQSPVGSDPRDPPMLASPATANGTPMPSEHDSDSGMSLAKPGSSAEAKERAEAHEGVDGDRRPPGSSKKDRRKRGRHDKQQEEDEDEEDKRRRRYRRREENSDSDREEKGNKRDREIDFKKEKRKEGAREKDRERDWGRSREKDRMRDYRDRDRKREDRGRDRV